MSRDAVLTHTTKPGFALALAGLVLALVSPVFWAITLDHSFLRRTALMMWIAMAIGLACATLGAWRDVRKRTRIVALFTGVWVLLSVPSYLVFTRLPAPARVASVDRVAGVTLSDHLGQRTSLGDLLREDPVLLVFYRGHW
jgi:hypothetical protein